MRRAGLAVVVCAICACMALAQPDDRVAAQAVNGVHAQQGRRGTSSVRASAIPAGAARRWRKMPSPNTSLDDQLLGVSCKGPDWCMAVGYSATGPFPAYLVLTEAWNGRSWSVVSYSGLPDSAFQYLNGISCVSRNWCMAVGRYFPGGTGSNLAELWNGSSWSQTPTPDVSSNDQLDAISCVTVSFCMAVGDGAGTLTEVWNGSAWSLVPSPDAGSRPSSDQARGVSCTSPGFCMMLDRYDSGPVQKTAIDLWNGASWSALRTPNPGPATNSLNGVYCLSARSCAAVGAESRSLRDATALVENWNGLSWSVEPMPSEIASDYLLNVACTTDRRCAAVGDRITRGFPGEMRTLAESSRDNIWLFGRTASPSPTGSALNDVSCGSTSLGHTYCVAVGYRGTRKGTATLAERY